MEWIYYIVREERALAFTDKEGLNTKGDIRDKAFFQTNMGKTAILRLFLHINGVLNIHTKDYKAEYTYYRTKSYTNIQKNMGIIG